MDVNGIGMIDYEKFNQVLNIETSSGIPKHENLLSDGF